MEARRVVFPAISTGIYGYTAEAATEVAATTVRACPTRVGVVTFVAFDRVTAQSHERRLGA